MEDRICNGGDGGMGVTWIDIDCNGILRVAGKGRGLLGDGDNE